MRRISPRLSYYAVKGEPLTDIRPKGDTSAYAVVRPRCIDR